MSSLQFDFILNLLAGWGATYIYESRSPTNRTGYRTVDQRDGFELSVNWYEAV